MVLRHPSKWSGTFFWFKFWVFCRSGVETLFWLGLDSTWCWNTLWFNLFGFSVKVVLKLDQNFGFLPKWCRDHPLTRSGLKVVLRHPLIQLFWGSVKVVLRHPSKWPGISFWFKLWVFCRSGIETPFWLDLDSKWCWC